MWTAATDPDSNLTVRTRVYDAEAGGLSRMDREEAAGSCI